MSTLDEFIEVQQQIADGRISAQHNDADPDRMSTVLLLTADAIALSLRGIETTMEEILEQMVIRNSK